MLLWADTGVWRTMTQGSLMLRRSDDAMHSAGALAMTGVLVIELLLQSRSLLLVIAMEHEEQCLKLGMPDLGRLGSPAYSCDVTSKLGTSAASLTFGRCTTPFEIFLGLPNDPST